MSYPAMGGENRARQPVLAPSFDARLILLLAGTCTGDYDSAPARIHHVKASTRRYVRSGSINFASSFFGPLTRRLTGYAIKPSDGCGARCPQVLVLGVEPAHVVFGWTISGIRSWTIPDTSFGKVVRTVNVNRRPPL